MNSFNLIYIKSYQIKAIDQKIFVIYTDIIKQPKYITLKKKHRKFNTIKTSFYRELAARNSFINNLTLSLPSSTQPLG
jgi:hypothetical protein